MQKWKVIFVLAAILLLAGCGNAEFQIAQQDRDVEIGILLRKEFTRDVCESRRYRHIQILLDGNEIMGYNIGVTPTPAFFKYVFTYIPGEVRNYNDLIGIREHYISVEAAKNAVHGTETGLKIVTDWARIKVTREQADKLRECWYEMRRNPPDFKLWGENCATRLADNFARAGILPSGLPGIDTPEGVLKLLRKHYPELTMERGYFGIDEKRQITFVPLDVVCN